MTEIKAPEGVRPVSEMQERIARAIWNIRREYEDRCDMELEDMGLGHEVWAESLAAMKAMREPTRPMVSAAFEAKDHVGNAISRAAEGGFSSGVMCVWAAMLDTEISIAKGDPAGPVTDLTPDYAQSLPGGKLDDSTYSKIEDALDRIGAPMTGPDGRWLSLHERIDALPRFASAEISIAEGGKDGD